MDSEQMIPGWDGLVTYNLLVRVLAMMFDNYALEGARKLQQALRFSTKSKASQQKRKLHGKKLVISGIA